MKFTIGDFVNWTDPDRGSYESEEDYQEQCNRIFVVYRIVGETVMCSDEFGEIEAPFSELKKAKVKIKKTKCYDV